MSLPGQIKHICNTGDTCDECGKPATWRICVEADSFGAEYEYCCDEHKPKEVSFDGMSCDRCGSHDGVKPMRDPAEGSHGPVYYLCAKHRQAIIDDFVDG